MASHAGLSPERWATFSLDQQILMIANEMNRAAKLMAPGDRGRLLSGYERTLQLTDLTVQVGPPALRRELLAGVISWPRSTSLLLPTPSPTPPPSAPCSS